MVDELNDQSKSISGVLKISAPRRAGRFFLDDLLVKYGKTFPEVRIEVLLNDEKLDLLTSGIDIAVRAQTILDEDTYALAIGRAMPMVVVGSPAYLKRCGTPKHPRDLVNHDGVCYAFEDSRKLAAWEFASKNSKYSVMPKPRVIVNDIDSLLAYCENGLGLAYTFAESAQTSIRGKRLVAVLEKQVAAMPGFSINYLSKRHLPLRVRAFIELAKQQDY